MVVVVLTVTAAFVCSAVVDAVVSAVVVSSLVSTEVPVSAELVSAGCVSPAAADVPAVVLVSVEALFLAVHPEISTQVIVNNAISVFFM